ncbi:MAG: GntR family transcriptional regulator [Azospirillaceae bacterium]|nr:GntR family transcriptional regulator [Azospirillaceae bacterium]
MQEIESPKPKLSEAIRQRLEEEIVTQQLRPGTRLDEMELAERYQVSRTPVREALHNLAAVGLIEIRPRRGAIVPQADPQLILEMFEVMAELEAFCARLAARRLTEPDRVALAAAHGACAAACERQNPDDYYFCNEKFHLALYEASQNHFLAEQATTLQRRLRPYRRLQLRLVGRLKSSLAEHQAVFQAIMDHDPDRAAEAIRDHVSGQGRGFSDLLAILARVHQR